MTSEQSKQRRLFMSGDASLGVFTPDKLFSLQLPCCATEAMAILIKLSDDEGLSFPSNMYLARRLYCSADSMNKRLGYLKKLNLISLSSFGGRKRVIRLNWFEINKRKDEQIGKRG